MAVTIGVSFLLVIPIEEVAVGLGEGAGDGAGALPASVVAVGSGWAGFRAR